MDETPRVSAPLTEGAAGQRAPSGRRRLALFCLAMAPVAALVGLLAWAAVQSGGNPGGLGVNSAPGEEPASGRRAPDFAVTTLDGGRVYDNEALHGEYALIDFWSSWCPPCRAEAPDLAAVYEEYEDAPVEFLGVAIWDQTRDVLAHVERYRVSYPNAMDADGDMVVAFGVRGIPEKYILDREGKIVRKLTGPVSRERLREILDELLASDG